MAKNDVTKTLFSQNVLTHFSDTLIEDVMLLLDKALKVSRYLPCVKISAVVTETSLKS